MKPQHLLRKIFPTSRRLLVQKSLRHVDFQECDRILIVGAGHDPYRSLFRSPEKYVKLDIKNYGDKDVVIGDAQCMPFDVNSFDCILATELLEHLSSPDKFIAEAARVLSQEGVLVLTVPYMYHRHGDPFDFLRFSLDGLKQLLGQDFYLHITAQGNRIHTVSDLISTAFSPMPLFFPLRLLNHVLVRMPGSFKYGTANSTAPSGYLVVCKRK